MTGRFLNADVYIDTGSGSPLSTNIVSQHNVHVVVAAGNNGSDGIFNSAYGFEPYLLEVKTPGNVSYRAYCDFDTKDLVSYERRY